MPTTKHKPAAKSKPTTPATMSKADFVRSMPNAKADDVAAKAKAAGHAIDAAYVYQVRSVDKRRAKRKAAKARGKAVGAPAVGPVNGQPTWAAGHVGGTAPRSKVEARFIELAGVLGFRHAIALLQEHERRLLAGV